MKTRKPVAVLLPFLATLVLSSCAGNNDKYNINKLVEKKPDVYVYTTHGEQPTLNKDIKSSGQFAVYFINDNPAPYLDISTGVEKAYLNTGATALPNIYAGYTHKNVDRTTVITNKVNQSTCVIDYDKQTLEFQDYPAFLNNNKHQVTPLDKALTGGEQHFKNVKKESYSAPKSSLVIDLKKYNLPIFFKNNVGYLPNELYCNILNGIPGAVFTYANDNVYVTSELSSDVYNNENKLLVNKEINAKFSKEYMEYCYNINALTLDTRFGMRERQSRADSTKTIKYNINAYENMNKYGKDKLISTDPNTAISTFSDMVGVEYDDSGHTAAINVGFLDNAVPKFAYGGEFNNFISVYKSLLAERQKAHLSPAETTGKANAIGDFKIFNDNKSLNDTAFLTMDSFVRLSTDYKTDDYYTNTMSLVYYANEQLRTAAGKNVKNLIIDLSVNTGGTTSTECFMSSWLSRGQTHLKTCSLLTGAFSDVTYQADVNGDNQITEADFLPDTVENIYLIVTPCSFSCGNLLPTDMRGYTDAKFIGDRSGGGASSVALGFSTGLGSVYQLSDNHTFCMKEATADNLITNDAGAGATTDKDYPISLSNPGQYYDRQTIFDNIHK